AMACGNYVIGYHGHGGREFFGAGFSASVEAGDVLGFARQVETAIKSDEGGGSSIRSRGRQAAAFIKAHYGMERETGDVIRTYSAFLQKREPRFFEAAL